MSRHSRTDDPIRARIEALGTSLNLPTVRKALGMIEGEHASQRRGGTDDLMDIRNYEVDDESRLIDWHASARTGRPMVVHRERLTTSRIWLLMDVGREMTGLCLSGEPAWQVAANALCMFATLSLRRTDDVSLVFGDSSRIVRVPFHGGFAQFENTLDEALNREWSSPRNIDALLDYARRINDKQSLIVIATDEHAIRQRHLDTVRRIAMTHPVVIIDVATINPFEQRGSRHTVDGYDSRRVPAFLIDQDLAREVNVHRTYQAAALERELTRCGSWLIRSSSSEQMFDAFVRMVSRALSGTMRNQLRSTPAILTGEAHTS